MDDNENDFDTLVVLNNIRRKARLSAVDEIKNINFNQPYIDAISKCSNPEQKQKHQNIMATVKNQSYDLQKEKLGELLAENVEDKVANGMYGECGS